MRVLANANDAAECAPWHVRGNEGQCAVECLLRGDWEGRVGHGHCNLVWRTRASWCCHQPLALDSVTQSALASTFHPPEFHEQVNDVAERNAWQKSSSRSLAKLVI